MRPITKLEGCSRKKFNEGLCGNYQGILFMNKGKREKLFFRSSEERETYYKKYLANKQYSKFIRYSVCSTTPPTRRQRRCGFNKNTTRKS